MTDPHEAALTAHQASEDRLDADYAANLAVVRERWREDPTGAAFELFDTGVPAVIKCALTAAMVEAAEKKSDWHHIAAGLMATAVEQAIEYQAAQLGAEE